MVPGLPAAARAFSGTADIVDIALVVGGLDSRPWRAHKHPKENDAAQIFGPLASDSC